MLLYLHHLEVPGRSPLEQDEPANATTEIQLATIKLTVNNGKSNAIHLLLKAHHPERRKKDQWGKIERNHWMKLSSKSS